MNLFVRHGPVIALLIGSVVGAGAVGKITTDPNTPQAREAAAQEQSTELGDPALEKKITYEAVDLPLSKILPDVSVLSGAKMLPSSSRENWRVRQGKAIAFINDRPVYEFKNGIALLFGYRWSCNTQNNKEKRYVLRDTLTSQKVWLEALAKQQKEAWERRAAGIDSALSSAEKARNISPDELKVARENDPYLYYLASDPAGKMWSQVLQQIPESWWQSAADGTSKNYMADSNDIPDGLGRLIEDILAIPGSASSTVSWVPPYTAGNEARNRPIAAISVSAGDANNPASIRVLYQLSQGILDRVEMFPIGPSTSESCYLLGKQAIAMEEGKSIDDSFNAAFDALKTNYSKLHKSTQVEEKPDKELLREIEHKPIPIYDQDGKMIEEIGLARQLRGLAKETGYTILVETFDWQPHERTIYTSGGFPPSKGTIQDVIKGIALSFYDFEKKGNLLMFRPKDWQKRRALEIDKEKVEQWEKLAKAQGGLLFYDMLDIVQNTTFDQIKETLMANSVLREAGVKNIYFSLYGVLRLISLLPDTNTRTAFCSEMGLPISVLKGLDLSEEQLKPYREIVQNEADNTFVGVTVRDMDKGNKDGRQEVVMFTRHGVDVAITETYLILPDFQVVMVREMLKQCESTRSKTQTK